MQGTELVVRCGFLNYAAWGQAWAATLKLFLYLSLCVLS